MFNFIVFPLLLFFATFPSNNFASTFSDHGEQCNAPWRPNLVEELKNCIENGEKCEQNGFECSPMGKCCPTKEQVCLSSQDSGHESDGQQFQHDGRFGYSPELGACIKFSYYGQGGNFNNFLRHSECQEYCRGIKRRDKNGQNSNK